MILLLGRPPVTDDLTRRGLLTAGLGTAGLWAAGCGTRDPAADVRTDREVPTDKGPVRVPAQASRVVCADFYGAFAVADLGLVPVGSGGDGYRDTSYAAKLAGVPSVGTFTEPVPEKVANAAPDLILRTIDTEERVYRTLSAIAPTVVISFQRLSLTEVAARVGDVLGRTAQADTLLASYADRTAGIRRRHAAVLGRHTFALVGPTGTGGWWTYGPAWTDTAVLRACGLRLAEPTASQRPPVQERSFEQLGVLEAADVLLVPAAPDGVTSAPENSALTRLDLWKRLPAVRAGRVHPVVTGASSLGTGLELAGRLDTVLGTLGG